MVLKVSANTRLDWTENIAPVVAGIVITASSQISAFPRGEIIKMQISLIELENFLWYMQDKVEEVYQAETKKAIRGFLADKYDK
ncbi:hypothetical protein [Lentibacillus cibarius]|uniref:Uncharacterized protein n=1 Tax=Lentibacillus cibarius TaxID=2583219 RepID=A0A5S3QGH6_9BACI|nr:hypothetical protein [Lentibacillus cibarius]TMN20948.1 hypothetical protein FFL34_01600 [Lentibacillus cibarius]